MGEESKENSLLPPPPQNLVSTSQEGCMDHNTDSPLGSSALSCWAKTQTVARGIRRADGPSIKALPTALLHELRQA